MMRIRKALVAGIALLACATGVRAQDSTRRAQPYFEFQVTKPVTQKPGSPFPR